MKARSTFFAIKAKENFSKSLEYLPETISSVATSALGTAVVGTKIYHSAAGSIVTANAHLQAAKYIPFMKTNPLLELASPVIQTTAESFVKYPVSTLSASYGLGYVSTVTGINSMEKLSNYAFDSSTRQKTLSENLFAPITSPVLFCVNLAMGCFNAIKSFKYGLSDDYNYGYTMEAPISMITDGVLDSSLKENDAHEQEELSIRQKEFRFSDATSDGFVDINRVNTVLKLGIKELLSPQNDTILVTHESSFQDSEDQDLIGESEVLDMIC